jgi:hypothetical protein
VYDHVQEAADHQTEYDRECDLHAAGQAAKREAETGREVAGQQARKQAGRSI